MDAEHLGEDRGWDPGGEHEQGGVAILSEGLAQLVQLGRGAAVSGGEDCLGLGRSRVDCGGLVEYVVTDHAVAAAGGNLYYEGAAWPRRSTEAPKHRSRFRSLVHDVRLLASERARHRLTWMFENVRSASGLAFLSFSKETYLIRAARHILVPASAAWLFTQQ